MSKQKVCWKITTRCNQGCKYCFGFSNIPELSFEENKEVLLNLIKSGVTNITWTGGEAILFSRLNELIKFAKDNGIVNKMVTNGIYIAQNDTEYIEEILDTLDGINLSIDSIDEKINKELGKEDNHLEIIKKVLEKTKNKKIKVGINTVVSQKNINELDKLGEFLNNYNIDTWKFLKFMPIRERALEFKKFEVDENELENKVNSLRKYENINVVKYKKQCDFEKSIVVLPNADIIRTDNGKDFKLGNARDLKTINFEYNPTIKKVKTFIALKDETIRNNVIELLKKINYVDLVGATDNGEDAINEIVDLKPELVFADYQLDDINGLEVIKRSSQKIENNIPIYNILTDQDISDYTLEVVELVGRRFNAIIRNTNSIFEIIQEYNDGLYDY